MDTNDVTYDKIIHRDINDEMQNCYIDYAMSVIVSRALPDVRDGLKPVHRRILYDMSELGLGSEKQYRKSARIVGDTMGKYHPHGDSSIYGSMVRLAQDFSTRYPLVDGQGNFGSIDGDEPAAMRYTEAKMSKLTGLMLADIDKDTVDFTDNFDNTLKEPTVLPSRFPNLLVNGSQGIAVGMATNIPPHNLTETVNAVIKMIDNYVGENEEHTPRETDIEELMAIITGPDFPTGATIYGRYGIEQAYRTGRGKIKVKSKAVIESMHGGRNRIVVTEIPYMVNKANLIQKMADLVKERRVEGISEIRDESDRNGISIVIELKRDANPTVVLNQLYKYTQLQDTFGVNMVALVDNKPRTLNLKQILEEYLKHQKEVVTRRTQFELNKAEARAHILEGLRKAVDAIDLVVSIIRSSKNTAEARERLMEAIDIDEIQANAILEMRLRALTGLEREKLESEYNEVIAKIEYLKSILGSEVKLLGVIKDELLDVRNKYGDERRTDITIDEDEYDIEDLIDEENIVITITQLGYIKRIPLDTYKNQNRGGKGIIGVNTIEEDFIKDIFVTTNFNNIVFFTNKGKAYKIKGYRIPEAGRTARGTAIVNLIQLEKDEKISAVFPVKDFEEDLYLTLVTKQGQIKKTPLKEFRNIRKGGLIALSLAEEDELVDVHLTNSQDSILVATAGGLGIMFKASDVRPMGRTARGVRAINLTDGDVVIGATIPKDGEQILTATENGLGKRTQISSFKEQHRGGKGLIINKLNERTGKIVGVASVSDDDELLIMTSQGVIIRIKVSQISSIGRNAQGVKLINLTDDAKVICMEKVNEDFIDNSDDEANEYSDADENQINNNEESTVVSGVDKLLEAAKADAEDSTNE